MDYLGHSANPAGAVELLRIHLRRVAARAARYAEAFSAGAEGHLAGLLHDLGKYGDLFQDVLIGKARRIDHWSAGAGVALEKYRKEAVAAALAIQGHHAGLQAATRDALKRLHPSEFRNDPDPGLKLSESNVAKLIGRFEKDGLALPDSLPKSVYSGLGDGRACAAMLDVRMLFSALVDADFIETEAHFAAFPDGSPRYRDESAPLDPAWALEALLAHMSALKAESKASVEVNALRDDLFSACVEAGKLAPGLFTMTAPTGAGKTLAGFAFALKHAAEHDLRRVIFVLPYLGIIEQTARTYRKVLEAHLKGGDVERIIIEHHSLAGKRREVPGEDAEGDGATEDWSRLLAENWDAPVIVTSSVQLLESLFSNRPSACRKLHRLARSVIVFDEAQTLPVGLAVPTLAALSRLSERYHASVVFATATQPAFSRLDAAVREFSGVGWLPREIVPARLDLFRRAARTRVQWPVAGESRSYESVARELSEHRQVLCIVNLKRDALALHDLLKEEGADGVFHLSTNMCPAHRLELLGEIRRRLAGDEPCRLVSTQCVEAGVDVDFAVVLRAFGPLEAVAQAGGRCNRNGKLECGLVRVFRPEESRYPDATYRQAADVTEMLLRERGDLDIHDPATFDAYYARQFSFAEPEKRNRGLTEAIREQDFVEVASRYRLIENNAVNVLVAYDPKVFRELREEASQRGLSRDWISRARPHSIGVFRPGPGDPVRRWLDPVPIRAGRRPAGQSHEWFIYLREDHYDRERGLVPPRETECLIA